MLLDRAGPDATVTARSPEAALLGVHPGMVARQACGRAPGAVFLRDTGDRVEDMILAASEGIRRDGAGVPETGRDWIAVHTGHLVAASRVLDAAASLEGMTILVGRGASVEEALNAARAARPHPRASRALSGRRAS